MDQNTQSSRIKIPHYTPPWLSNPITKPFSMSPLYMGIQLITCAFANINTIFYVFFFQKLLCMSSFTDYKSIDCRGIHKRGFWKENLAIVHTQSHILVCTSLIKDKNTFSFPRQVGREGGKGWRSLCPKISQEWTLTFLFRNKTTKSLKTFIRPNTSLMLLHRRHLS